jgi:hypothetical protein
MIAQTLRRSVETAGGGHVVARVTFDKSIERDRLFDVSGVHDLKWSRLMEHRMCRCCFDGRSENVEVSSEAKLRAQVADKEFRDYRRWGR